MKRLIALFLALTMFALAFTACGNDTEGQSSTGDTQSTVSGTESGSGSGDKDTSDGVSTDSPSNDASNGGSTEESGTTSDNTSDGENSDAPDEPDTPDTPDTPSTPDADIIVPQRLLITDGREVYTRIYSMYVSGASKDVLKTDASNLQSMMVGVKYFGQPIGGADYKGKIYTTGDYIVETDNDMKDAIKSARSGDVIFIPSGVTIDMADLYATESLCVKLSEGVILASDRGVNEGGVLRISHPSKVLISASKNCTITGLNILGVVTQFAENTATVTDIGISVTGENVTISNCEIASFSGAAISTGSKGKAKVDNCYIHHCETGINDTNGTITLSKSAFYGNNADYVVKESGKSLPSSCGVMTASDIAPLTVERVNPDITMTVFPVDQYEVYELLGEVASGDTSKIIKALATHSGTTNYYEFKDQLTIKKNGTTYGISDTSDPLGGGEGYSNIYTTGTYIATDLSTLVANLKKAKSGDVVFIPGGVQIDVSSTLISIPSGVTLASDRGRVLDDGTISTGAMLYCTERKTMMIRAAANAHVAGLTVVGPDYERHMTHHKRGLNAAGSQYTSYYYSLLLTRGIVVNGKGVEIENCEISGFSEAGVALTSGVDIKVHHNFIHHNQRNGFGYGVVLYGSIYVEVYGNLFNFDRHAIAADGKAGSGYQAHDNVHMGTAIYHIFDAHGGGDRGDGTQIACERIDMYNNVFLSDKIPYKKRGTPEEYSKFTHNIVIYPETYYPYRQMYGENFIIEDNIFGIADPATEAFDFEGGKTFKITKSSVNLYEGVESIDAKGYALRYKNILVFAPDGNGGYYISEYGNNLDDGSIYGGNDIVKIPEGGFVITFQNSGVAKQLYDAISSRHGVIYNTTIGLFGDYIAEIDGNTIVVTQSK